jgi:integrase
VTAAPGIIQSRQTLAEFVEEEWWPRYAVPNLAPDTRRRYLEVWGTHLLPRLGDYELREITPMVVEDVREQMTRAKIGVPTQRKTLMLLQAVLRRAVVRGLIPVNAARLVDKPKQRPTQLPQPLSPVTVERIRAGMLQPRTRVVPAAGVGKRPRCAYETLVGTPRDRQRNALIVSMLAYAGLRPIEDRGCTWAELHDRTLHVFATKTGRARDVDLIAPLAQDLAEWRMACGRRGRHRRPAAVSAPRLLRLATPVGGPEPDVRRRAGRPLRGDARAALRRDAARARERAPGPRRRGHPSGPRGDLRDALRTHPANHRPSEIAESPMATGVGDTGLEPVTSALSRRRSPS